MVLGCLFTLLLLTAVTLNTPTGIFTITHISMSQTTELGNVKRKSRMLISINGLSGTIVKCSNVSFNVLVFFAIAQTELRDNAVTALVSQRQPGGVS